MMKWIIISEDYLSYLRSFEKRIPQSDYGKNHFKPFFGVLFETRQMSQYIQFLKIELRLINKLALDAAAQKLYHFRYNYPDHAVSRRCLDFQMLEGLSRKYLPPQTNLKF